MVARVAVVAAFAASVVPSLLAGSSVQADPVPARPRAVFVLSVQPQVASRDFAGRWGASLTCDPTGGAHKYRHEACAQLRAADGFVERIAPVDRACTLEYLPVEVRAEGLWRGESRSFAKVFPNPCVARVETGGVLFAY